MSVQLVISEKPHSWVTKTTNFDSSAHVGGVATLGVDTLWNACASGNGEAASDDGEAVLQELAPEEKCSKRNTTGEAGATTRVNAEVPMGGSQQSAKSASL